MKMKIGEILSKDLLEIIADTDQARRAADDLAVRIYEDGQSLGIFVIEVGVKRPSKSGMWKKCWPLPATEGHWTKVPPNSKLFRRWVRYAREKGLWLAWVQAIVPESQSNWLAPAKRKKKRDARQTPGAPHPTGGAR